MNVRRFGFGAGVSRTMGSFLGRLTVVACLALSMHLLASPSAKAQIEYVDTALVVSVDVSNSIDEERYRLQMKGIADALEDPAVMGSILNGPNGAVMFALVTWADHPRVGVPWTKITSKAKAKEVAARIRQLPRHDGEFTCLGRMLEFLNNKILPQIPARALRTVVDVSGDGRDNCNPERPLAQTRDEIVRYGTIINGLPILTGSEGETLKKWYETNVKGGPGSFILPADGFKDFGRAIRQKFVIEISGYDAQKWLARNRSFARAGAAPLNR